jgi:hypothetical protein
MPVFSAGEDIMAEGARAGQAASLLLEDPEELSRSIAELRAAPPTRGLARLGPAI